MNVEIRTIQTPADLLEVYRLTYREYLKAGYVKPNADKLLAHHAELDRQTTVLGAYRGDELVGTNSITIDGPYGLHVDQDFPDEVAGVRALVGKLGLNLGASWRLVTSGHNYGVLLDLIRAAIREGCRRALHVTLYSVHPRHVRAYRRLLGLTAVKTGVCRAAGGNPAVLMLGDSDVVTDRCARLAQRCLDNCSPPKWPRSSKQIAP